MSVARHHAEWLSLIEVSGPFLSMPVLMRIFPQGLDERDPSKAKELRLAYEEWVDKPNAPGRQRAWVDFVFTRLLEFPAVTLAEGQNIPSGLEAPMAEYGETLRPDFIILAPPGHASAGTVQLLVHVYPPGHRLDTPVVGKHWKASPATRMTELLHASNVSLGLVTNGEHWMLVFAPRGETTGYASWYAGLWLEEPITLRAFHSLLHLRRFLGVAEGDTLFALLKESTQDQQEVTDQLGLQVRRAVEVLVQALDRLDQDSGRKLLSGVDTKVLYEAALTVMMRLVFLFFAEERGLLRLGESLYDENYAVSTLREQLRDVADQHGEEVLERRFDAWSRLLATFRAVHGGVDHEALRLPAYGGTLFDPDRYPFLEGRPSGTSWRAKPAKPLAVSNRVVLHLLESLQVLQVKVPGGGPAQARRLSFRALDIEPIGNVYEGLLDHTAMRASTTFLGIQGTKDKEPEISLERLEELLAEGEDRLIEFMTEETKRSKSALLKALREPQLADGHKILVACGQDTVLRDRILPFAGLIREDSFQMPVVILKGSVFVTQGTTRRSTGTHYTPRSLTEPIVKHTLEPVVYGGPAEGWPKENWRLRSPGEILSLKVCDMAMGSGAFLVQSCRYLAERLVEAWENHEQSNPGKFIVAPEGDLSTGDPAERLLPKDPAERLAIARRFVADRCLFGVDINPMAVEMAKLTLWLITVQRDRPFTFLDHALKCGDSLLGISRFRQLETFSLDDVQAKQVLILSNYEELIQTAISKRHELEALPSNDATQIAAKEALNAEAEEQVSRLKLASDLLIATALAKGNAKQKELGRLDAHLKVTEYIGRPLEEFRQFVRKHVNGRRPFHWPLEFPEIFKQGGFDAFVGNPPFMGGQKITGACGADYRDYLVTHLANGKRGSADLCAYFFTRAFGNLAEGGAFGLLATKTIAQGDTREISLVPITCSGGTIYNAVASMNWPGDAAVFVSIVHIIKSDVRTPRLLNGQPVSHISNLLDASEGLRVPKLLTVNSGKSYQGSNVLGMGFVLGQDEALGLIKNNPMNKEVIFPYLNGEDLNSHPTQLPSRWVINFFDWPLEKAERYKECIEIVRNRVFPERQKNRNKQRREVWWRFTRPTIELYESIAPLRRVLVIALTSNTLAFAFLPKGLVYSHATVVLAFDSSGIFCLLQSTLHTDWARTFGSSMKGDQRYTPTDCFENFPFPQSTVNLDEVGDLYHEHRHQLMVARQEGLTKTYNRLHDVKEKSEDITRMRTLHVEMDQAVAVAYGWKDLDLGHGFHEIKQGLRFTVSNSARRTVLDRLLELNHQRYEEEVKAGLHDKNAMAKSTGGKRGRKSKRNTSKAMLTLFDREVSND